MKKVGLRADPATARFHALTQASFPLSPFLPFPSLSSPGSRRSRPIRALRQARAPRGGRHLLHVHRASPAGAGGAKQRARGPEACALLRRTCPGRPRVRCVQEDRGQRPTERRQLCQPLLRPRARVPGHGAPPCAAAPALRPPTGPRRVAPLRSARRSRRCSSPAPSSSTTGATRTSAAPRPCAPRAPTTSSATTASAPTRCTASKRAPLAPSSRSRDPALPAAPVVP